MQFSPSLKPAFVGPMGLARAGERGVNGKIESSFNNLLVRFLYSYPFTQLNYNSNHGTKIIDTNQLKLPYLIQYTKTYISITIYYMRTNYI